MYEQSVFARCIRDRYCASLSERQFRTFTLTSKSRLVYKIRNKKINHFKCILIFIITSRPTKNSYIKAAQVWELFNYELQLLSDL